MHYEVKPLAEFLWAMLQAGLIAGGLAFLAVPDEKVGDWRVWAAVVGIAVARAVVGKMIELLTKPR